jgi:transcriptional regulator with XRE-family HTH domain
LVGISVDFLSLIARGINSPGFEVLERMADRLGMQVRELFDFRKTGRTGWPVDRTFSRLGPVVTIRWRFSRAYYNS